MVILVKKTNQKNHVSFMPHAFSKKKHPFDSAHIVIKLNLLKSHDFL
jgi:hypothetical protein